jgi:ElaB/YqjD/DUF883 family membrane-anchored ribosome-binding protein
MDHETEAIREQMDDTRESLAKKLETLEKEVAGAVQNVTGTVETVSQTVEQVKEAVEGTVASVKDSVAETVDTAKETVRDVFDIPGHVCRHPWLSFGCSFAAGFLTGRLVPPVAPAAERLLSRRTYGAPSLSALAEPGRHNGREQEQRPEGPPAPKAASQPGWLDSLASSFGPELGKLKGLAIGAMLGMARDAVTRSLPPEMASQVKEVINDFTGKLGGEVMHGPVLGQPRQPHHDGPAAASGAAG